ncbi:MAG: geranylgeranyl reductase family protein [Desulfobacteraceae bacterium]|nr:geranylgeranyl reductase family protein [Desulfobacteraceae bacterium]
MSGYFTFLKKTDKSLAMFDVAIIGAGPSGNAAAYDLLSAGLRVVLLDKSDFPRVKACAGGLTPKALNLLKYDITPVIKKECRKIKITSSTRKSFILEDKNTLCHMTRRDELDLFSLEKVLAKGGAFHVERKIKNVVQTPSHIEIETGSRTFKARYLIGADGANSFVRKFVKGMNRLKQNFAVEARVRVDNPARFLMELEFPSLVKGYRWVFPLDDHVNIGIYSTTNRTMLKRKILTDFAKIKIGSDRLEGFKGYPICSGGYNCIPCSDRIILVGDAAGFAEGFLGEGLYFAIKSGQEAARAIVDSKRKTKSACKLYQQYIQGIKTDLRLYQWSANLFYTLPWACLKLVSSPLIHSRFVKGFGNGKTLKELWMIASKP